MHLGEQDSFQGIRARKNRYFRRHTIIVTTGPHMTLTRSLAQSSAVHPYKPRTENLISWSKNGFIAFISPALATKNSVFLSHIESADGWGWRLAPTESIKIDKNVPHALSMVSWSDLNTDLAVADVHGNFYILLAGVGLVEPAPEIVLGPLAAKYKDGAKPPQPSISPSYELTSYNHMEMIYRDVVSEKETAFSSESACATSFVAFKWLNIEKPHATNLPATRAESSTDWQYPAAQYPAYGAAHPIATKEACVALRRNGEFIMYFQGEHKVEYHKMSSQIEDAFLNISMASFGLSHDKNIYLTVYDTLLGKIRVYVIIPDWGYLVESSKRQKADPHYHTPLHAKKGPCILVVKVHEMSPIAMLSDLHSCGGNEQEKEQQNEEDYVRLCALASIDMVSANGASNSDLDLFITYHTRKGSNGVPSSTVYRYNLVPDLKCILQAFFELGSRKGISPANPNPIAMSLSFQSSISRLGTVESISSLNSEPFFMIAYREGHIDIFDRQTMRLVSHPDTDDDAPTPNIISSQCDAGFDFPLFSGNVLPLVMALSPTASSIVCFDLKDPTPTLELHIFEKNRHKTITPENMALSIAGIAHRHAYCCYSNTCSDDLIVLLEHEIQRIASLMKLNGESDLEINKTLNEFVEMLLVEAHKAVNFHLDAFSKELVDKLLSNPPLQKLLSLQLAVKEYGLRSLDDATRDVAWTVLNLRSASFGVMFSLSSIYRQVSKKKPIEDSLSDSLARGECIISLVGNMKWLADLMIYLSQELLELGINKTGAKQSSLTIENALVVPLLLGKVPRLFLMYAISSLGKTNDILKKLHKDLSEANKLFTPMRESLSRCFAICNNIPLSLTTFEAFLRECDSLITNENNAVFASKDKNFPLSHQRDLMCRGHISEPDKIIANQIIDKYSAAMSHDTNVADMYFYDTNWLQLGLKWRLQSPGGFLIKNAILPLQKGDHIHTTCRLQYSRHTFIDCLRKILVSSKPTVKGKGNYGASPTKATRMRKCVRCRSVSLVSDPTIFEPPSAIGLWTMVFQRTCVCGSAWTNCEV